MKHRRCRFYLSQAFFGSLLGGLGLGVVSKVSSTPKNNCEEQHCFHTTLSHQFIHLMSMHTKPLKYPEPTSQGCTERLKLNRYGTECPTFLKSSRYIIYLDILETHATNWNALWAQLQGPINSPKALAGHKDALPKKKLYLQNLTSFGANLISCTMRDFGPKDWIANLD